jgi:hypothetical protein
VVARGFAVGEAWDAEVVLVADFFFCAANTDLRGRWVSMEGQLGLVAELTVEVMSDEHTSQTYLMPPSVPRVPVFFLMTPMAEVCMYGGVGAGGGSRIAARASHARTGGVWRCWGQLR